MDMRFIGNGLKIRATTKTCCVKEGFWEVAKKHFGDASNRKYLTEYSKPRGVIAKE